jgi:general secretion pathway protein F
MPLFRYKAVATDGQMLYGEIDAPSKAVAISRLQSSGHLPISAEEVSKSANIFVRLINKSRQPRSVKQGDILLFTRELATLLNAGLPLDNALKTLEGVNESMTVLQLIQSIREKVQGGRSLSDAIAEQEGVFTPLYINLVRAGEAGGSLQIVMERIADYMERMQSLKNTIVTAMIYPIILLFISLLSLFVLMTFVVPQFEPLFADAGESLPLLTVIVFALASFIQNWWWLMLILFTGTVWFIDLQLKDRGNRLAFDAYLLTIVKIGPLIQQVEVARFSRTLSTLMANGVPLLTALSLVKDVISNRAIADVMPEIVASLEQGQGLVKPMRKANRFPALAIQLISVGEESGQLEPMLSKLADIYDRDVETSIKRLLSLMEPIMIIGLGGIIAVIIMSILLAMLGINEMVAL